MRPAGQLRRVRRGTERDTDSHPLVHTPPVDMPLPIGAAHLLGGSGHQDSVHEGRQVPVVKDLRTEQRAAMTLPLKGTTP
jgi:hypothetical protein